MPYSARKHQLHNSLVYHAYNRSNGRVEIFHGEEDYRYFINLLIEYSQKYSAKVYHWVIMPNHYHLLLEIPSPEEISVFMAGLNRKYACYHHRLYRSAGFLWQGRFKLQPIQKEDYLIACARYIERNPVRAKIVTEAIDYPYSSARFHCLGDIDNLTSKTPCINDFGSDNAQRMASYAVFLRDFDQDQERRFDNLETPQGNVEFLKRLTKEGYRYFPKRRGRPKQRAELFCSSLDNSN